MLVTFEYVILMKKRICCFNERKNDSRRIRIHKVIELKNSTLINLCLLLMHVESLSFIRKTRFSSHSNLNKCVVLIKKNDFRRIRIHKEVDLKSLI
jgi:hypothetical protein